MVIAYTECFYSFDNSGGTDGVWAGYNAYTNLGIPKGAVLEVVLANQYDIGENNMGVRTDGSSLARFVLIHEAEPDGSSCLTMLVTVHATTGLIEIYHGDVSDAHKFFVVGYWTGVTFVEAFGDNNISTAGSWTDLDLGTANSKLHTVIIASANQDASFTGGVRKNGSALVRNLLIHEPEAGGYSGFMFYVDSDATDKVEYWISEGTTKKLYDLGYFSDVITWTEAWMMRFMIGGNKWSAEDDTKHGSSGYGSYTGTNLYPIRLNSYYRVGQNFASITLTFSDVWVKVKAVGAPTGNLICRVRDGTTKAVTSESATVNTNMVTTAGNWIKFTFSSAVVLTASASMVMIEQTDGTSDVSNYVALLADVGVEVYSGNIIMYNGSSWSEYGNVDVNFMWLVDNTTSSPYDMMVALVTHTNYQLSDVIGLRKVGSTDNRYIDNHETESSSSEFDGFTCTTNLDANASYESFCESTEGFIFIQGYIPGQAPPAVSKNRVMIGDGLTWILSD